MALAKPTMQTQAPVQAPVETQVEVEAVQAMAAEAVEIPEHETEVVESLVEVEPELVEAIPTTARAVVQATQTREVASPMASASQFSQAMADLGFEGLKLDGFSFPTIVLPGEGFFQLSGDEESNLGKSFVFNPESSTSRYMIKESDDKDAESFMSYDPTGATKTDGSDATSLIRQWAADSGEEDYKPIVKQYIDVVATVVEADPSSEHAQELIGETVMISIPHTSISRFSGVMRRGLKRGPIGTFDIEASVARKVKTEGGGFYPWAFNLV